VLRGVEEAAKASGGLLSGVRAIHELDAAGGGQRQAQRLARLALFARPPDEIAAYVTYVACVTACLALLARASRTRLRGRHIPYFRVRDVAWRV